MLMTTALLLYNKLVSPSIENPIILSLYLRAFIRSTDYFMAIHFELKVELSTLFSRLENHTIGDQFTSIKTPVWDLLVTLHLALSASTKNDDVTELLLALVVLEGISSLTFG